jgi:hypothetical protein
MLLPLQTASPPARPRCAGQADCTQHHCVATAAAKSHLQHAHAVQAQVVKVARHLTRQQRHHKPATSSSSSSSSNWGHLAAGCLDQSSSNPYLQASKRASRAHAEGALHAVEVSPAAAAEPHLLGQTTSVASVSLRKGSRKAATGLAVKRPPAAAAAVVGSKGT